MQFNIEKNIKVPSRWSDRGYGLYNGMYPFPEMEVGDSFLYKAQSGNERARSRLHSAINYYLRSWEPDGKFIVRQVNEGYRVWRVK